MIIYSRVTDQPAVEPVTLAEAKVHLEYQGTAKDSYITGLIKTARRICEAYAGLSFVTQERSVKLDHFPFTHSYIDVPYGPVQTIDSFTYLNEDGTTTTMVENTDFVVDTHSGICRLYAIDASGEIDLWPTDIKSRPNAITINYTAGYDEAINEPLPEIAKQAMMMQIGSLFEQREDARQGEVTPIFWNSMTLLDMIKVTWNANQD
jgi:uncharacterized phiE125 gp8 family phage protein